MSGDKLRERHQRGRMIHESSLLNVLDLGSDYESL